MPHEEAEKELEVLDDGLALLQEEIKSKAYIETYMQNFTNKVGGDWIRKWDNTTVEITEFFFFWNTTISCEVNCHYFQFRRDYIAFVK